MKKYTLIILIIFIPPFLSSAQETEFNLEKAISEIKGGNYNGILLNNKLVEEYQKNMCLKPKKEA